MNTTRGTAAFTMNYGKFPWFSSVNNLVNIFSFYSERFFAHCAKKVPRAGWAHRRGGHEAADQSRQPVFYFCNAKRVNSIVPYDFLPRRRVNHHGLSVGDRHYQSFCVGQQCLLLGLKSWGGE